MKWLKRFFQSKPENITPPIQQAQQPTRLVLIGTGGAGKSSILRACDKLQKSDILKPPVIIYERILCFIWDWKPDEYYKLTKEGNEHFIRNSRLPPPLSSVYDYWSEKLGRGYYKLYWDSGYQDEIYKRRNQTSFGESVHYFMRKKNYKRLLSTDGYKLNMEDTIFASYKTTGIVQRRYRDRFTLFDTGGQRNERKKWHLLLEDNEPQKVAFVISLSEFNELCYEDGTTNRYNEGIFTFMEWYEHELMKNNPIYLIFSKYDVLEEKVRNGLKFSHHVPEFTGDDNNVECIVEFIVKNYLSIDREKRIVKWFTISALNHDQVRSTIDEILDCVEEKPIQSEIRSEIQSEIQSVTKKEGLFKLKQERENALIDDILYNVLQFMSLDELVETFMLVSKQWAEVASRVPVIMFRPNLDIFVNNSTFGNVRVLNLQSTFLQRRHVEMLAHHPKFKKLEYLNVSNNYSLSMYDWEYLFSNNKFEHLTVIAMDYCNLTSFNFLMKLPKVKIASLKGNRVDSLESYQHSVPFKIDSNIGDFLLEL